MPGLKDELMSIGLSSSSHGLPNILSAEKIHIKLMWIMCYISAAVLFAYLIGRNVTLYFEYEVVTNIKSFIDIPSILPAITVCIGYEPGSQINGMKFKVYGLTNTSILITNKFF